MWIGLALVLAGVAIGYLFSTKVEQRVRLDLAARLNRLIAIIDPSAFPGSLVTPLQDPRYETPFGGLYWQVTDLDLGETARSRSLWDFEVTLTSEGVDDGEPHYAVIDGPSDQALSALGRVIRYQRPGGVKRFMVIVAEDRAALAASIREFWTELAVALGILGIVLIGAAWLQVQLGLRPLKTIRAGIEAVKSGKASRLQGAFPSEVQPLVVEVNDLLRSQEASIAFARARAADLAHGLKTPLAVLATTSSGLRARGDEETAALVEEMTGDMADRVDYQLRLSRLRLRTRTEIYSASLQEALEKTIGVLKRTRSGEELRWDAEIDPGLMVDVDRQDLIELLGVLLENAAKWGRSVVAVRACGNGAAAEILIEEDGPGLTPEQREALGKRGVRLDGARGGSGLGLSIAAEIVRLNNGTIDYGDSAKGGLAVRLSLPLAR